MSCSKVNIPVCLSSQTSACCCSEWTHSCGSRASREGSKCTCCGWKW